MSEPMSDERLDRIRAVAPHSVHADEFAELLAEVDRLRSDLEAARRELTDEHQPSPDGHGCVVCYPQDGRWPCTSALIVAALAEHTGGDE